MDPLDTARIRRSIERRLDALRGEITDKLGDAALVNEGLDRNADSGDLSVADETATADFADARRDVEEYQAGRIALARLDSGDYGTCADCGDAIPAARLAAQPFAVRCVACQERRERATGLHRTST
ncbi:MAG: TraR/DksA family transcriptional regulator [Burkholderiales bacterium]